MKCVDNAVFPDEIGIAPALNMKSLSNLYSFMKFEYVSEVLFPSDGQNYYTIVWCLFFESQK